MSPEASIAKLDQIVGGYARFGASLRAEVEQIQDEWEGLRIAGGQRADHAAALMSRLRNILRDAASFCKVVESQIDGMVADPFETKGGGK